MCPLPFYLLMRLAQTGRNQKFNSRQRFFSREQPPSSLGICGIEKAQAAPECAQ